MLCLYFASCLHSSESCSLFSAILMSPLKSIGTGVIVHLCLPPLGGSGCTLTVYQVKTAKNVLLLSTMHSTVDIGDDRKSEPKTVTFYNSTKFGVDVVNQMARKYTVNAASCRWLVQFFYNILDLAAINTYV